MEQSKKFQYVCMFESQKQAKRFADYLGKKKVAIEALEEEGDTIFASSVQIILLKCWSNMTCQRAQV